MTEHDAGTPALSNTDYDRLLRALEPIDYELADSLVILVDLVAGATERRGFEPPAMGPWSAIVGALDSVRDNLPEVSRKLSCGCPAQETPATHQLGCERA